MYQTLNLEHINAEGLYSWDDLQVLKDKFKVLLSGYIFKISENPTISSATPAFFNNTKHCFRYN